MNRHYCLRIVADDLSGAAECAAALAVAGGAPVPLVLTGALPDRGVCAIDTDSRALDAHAAGACAARALASASGADPAQTCLFKKIDSTLRGHVAAELRAALALPGLARAVVVCPALPQQGRTLQRGVLHVHGELQRDGAGAPVDLCRLLEDTGAHPVLLENQAPAHPRELAAALADAVASGTRVIVVDAADAAALQRLARALVLLAPMRLLAAGSAGLARALAQEILLAREIDTCPDAAVHPAPVASASNRGSESSHLPTPARGPVVAVVGSFSRASAAQLRSIRDDGAFEVIALVADLWLNARGSHELAAALDRAGRAADQGRGIVFAVAGAPAAPQSSRALVQAMAAAAEPIVRRASTLVLTGGDTARSVLDRLGIEGLQVRGEFEPGICISGPAARSGPCIVTKAGSFGDPGALLRVLRHFEARRPANTILKESA